MDQLSADNTVVSEDSLVDENTMPAGNPLLAPPRNPLGIPEFSNLSADHFQDAVDNALDQHLAEIRQIKDSAETASFANTVLALDCSGQLLTHVLRTFQTLTASNTSDALQALESQFATRLAEHDALIFSDEALFARVDLVMGESDALDEDESLLLAALHRRFVKNGVALPAEQRERVAAIDSELASLKTQFRQNLLRETNGYQLVLSKDDDLVGLPSPVKQAAAEEARARGYSDAHAFTISRSSFAAFMKFSERRDLRKSLFLAYTNAGNNDNEADNKTIVKRIVALRSERAQLLGYQTHADFALEDRMAGTVGAVRELLDQLWPAARRRLEQERQQLTELANNEGLADSIEPWDWMFYAEKLRKQAFNFDDDQVKPYFELSRVRDGAFHVAGKLWGIRFQPVEDAPRYHPDVEVFEVIDADGSHLGVFIADYFMRASKRGGAWMSVLRPQRVSEQGTVRPIVLNNCNFAKGAPTLLALDEVRTLFHEFGHAMHGLLSDVRFEGQSCSAVKWDFVELPSQLFEHWAREPEVMRHYARHFETDEPIPEALIEGIRASSTFNQGFATSEYLTACYLDLAWHELTEPTDLSVAEFENQAMQKLGLDDASKLRYRSTYFQHIFAGDAYAAGYYVYIWASVLDNDAYELFRDRGVFDEDTAQRLREVIYSKGGSAAPMDLYRQFRGSDPDIAPLLRNRGLEV